MKRSSKYNLLAKNEPKKEKDQQEWVELESVRKWQGKASNNDTSYVKFQEQQYSEVQRDNVPLNKGIEKSTYPINQVKNINKSSLIDEKRMAYLQQESRSKNFSKVMHQQNITKPQVTSQKIPQKQQQSINIQTRPSQSYMNPSQSEFNNYPINPRLSTFYQYGQNYGSYQNQSMYMPDQAYRQSQYNNFGHSQMPYSQSYYPQQYPNQFNQSNHSQQPNIHNSTLKSSTRSSTRKGIPQMTVNCDKCTFTQSVPGNSQMYICCMCNQINECFPLYGVFTCGICRANVIYPHGTSRLIKCTKCQTVNRVNPEPSKKIDQVVTMGKQRSQLQQEYIERLCQIEQKPQKKMSRNEQQQFQQQAYKQQKANFERKSQQPFRILPAKKQQGQKQQIDFFDEQNQPQITQDRQLKRQQTQLNNLQFKQELIDFSQAKQKDENKLSKQKKQLHEQLLELNAKLDQSLIIINNKQTQTINSVNNYQVKRQNYNKKGQIEYPSIFDD